MIAFDRTLPPLLAELHRLELDYADGEGIDFEPFDEFLSASENASWIAAWTGNKALDGAEYRIFGQDGTGGYAAFWLTRESAPLLEQPIVFLGSEGDVGVIARDFADYLWLLAAGLGPFEAIECPSSQCRGLPHFIAFATANAPSRRRPVSEILDAAAKEFPSFAGDVRAACR